jgi:ABC-type multidrug transport system ATPase subunit
MLLRALCDLDPWSGFISLNGTEATATPAPQWRRRMGFLPAESRWWYDTVGEHFPSEVPGEYMGSVDFEPDVLKWQVSRLSSGEKQRLALVRLLCVKPRALLLDEPTTHLDPERVLGASSLIRMYREESRVPVLWVAHNRARLEEESSRRYCLVNGQLVQEKDPE